VSKSEADSRHQKYMELSGGIQVPSALLRNKLFCFYTLYLATLSNFACYIVINGRMILNNELEIVRTVVIVP
jgi:hypothetical protein